MLRCFIRLSMAIACRALQAALEHCTKSWWSVGPRTRWNGRHSRLCSGNWKSSLCFRPASTASPQWLYGDCSSAIVQVVCGWSQDVQLLLVLGCQNPLSYITPFFLKIFLSSPSIRVSSPIFSQFVTLSLLLSRPFYQVVCSVSSPSRQFATSQLGSVKVVDWSAHGLDSYSQTNQLAEMFDAKFGCSKCSFF